MNTKNRIIQKLLGVAKKHRVLTYPVLALVAIISVISNLFSWSTGAGKRVVAVVMVMVMLVSQSYFLTSSATEAIDDEETALVQQELQQEELNRRLDSDDNNVTSVDSTENTTEVADSSLQTNDEDIIDDENMNSGVTADQAVEQDFAVSDNSTEDTNIGTTDNTSEDLTDNSDIDENEVESKLDGEEGDEEDEEENNLVRVIFNYQQPGGSGYVKMTDGIPDVFATTSDPADGKKTITGYVDSSNEVVNIQDIFNKLDDENNKWTVDGCYDFYGNTVGNNVWCRDEECNTPATGAMTINEGDTEFNLYAQCKLARVYMKLSDSLSTGKNESSLPTVGGDNKYKEITDDSGEVRYYFNLDSSGKAVATISNAEIFGYELTDVMLGSSSIDVNPVSNESTDGDTYHNKFSVNITLTNASASNSVKLIWDPMPYRVVYSPYEYTDPLYSDPGTAATGIPRDYVYDKSSSFASSKNLITDLKTGYDLLGWVIDGSGYYYNDSDSFTELMQRDFFNYYYCHKDALDDNAPSIRHARMFPYYEYADVEMYVTTNDSEVKLDNNKITYVYDMPGNEYKFSARYKYKDSTRSSDIGNFTYNATATGAADIGITVSDHNSETPNYSSVTTTGPTGVNDGDSSIPLSIRVTDNLDGGVQKIKTFSDYSISVRRKKIKIVDNLTISQKRKEFDGNKELRTERAFPTEFDTVSDEASDLDTSTSIKVTYDKAEFESADASNNVNIIIHNPHLSGTNSNCYDLTGKDTDDENNETLTISGGIIRQRNVSVDTVYKGNDLLAGQDDPDQSEYTLKLSDGEDFDGVDGVDDIDDAIDGGHFGTITYSLKDRTQKNVPGDYAVYADFKQDGNFYVTVRNRGVVKVGQKAPQENVNFKIAGVTKGTRQDDGIKWYYTGTNPKISPIITTEYNYNKIIVSDKALSDSELSSATGEDSYTVTEADNGKELYIWLKNSGNKAITTSTKVTIYYDATEPQYENYNVTELKSDEHTDSYISTEGSGLYFPNIGSVLDFGTYTNNTININITYSDYSEGTDKPSGMEALYYRLYSNTGSQPNNGFDLNNYQQLGYQEVLFDKNLGDNRWAATITLLKEVAKRGSIDIIAYDKAGNNCGGRRLKPDESTDDYEWIVEDELTKPERPVVNYSNYSDNEVLYSRDSASGKYSKSSDEAKRSIYIVTDANGKSEKSFYNHCQATVTVKDTMSGIKRVEWYDNGELVQVDSNGWEVDENYNDSNYVSGHVNNEEITLTYVITKDNQGKHNIYVKVIDNAGNEVESDSIEFATDDDDPTIVLNDFSEDSWTDSSIIGFTAYDTGDHQSGIDTVKVINSNGELSDCNELKKQSDGSFTGKFDISKIDYDKESGVCYYGLLAIDNAGNVYKLGGKFDKLSNSVPEHPIVTYLSTDNSSEEESNSNSEDESESDSSVDIWYINPAKITVTYPGDSSEGKPIIKPEGVPVKIIYRIYDDAVGEALYDADFDDAMSKDITISKDGVYHVEAWAESASGIKCGKDDHIDSFDMLKIDKTKPEISAPVTEKNGGSQVVKYDITDATSGVDPTSISLYYNDSNEKDTKTDIKWEKIDNGYCVSYTLSKTGKYTLKVSDIAGNIAETSIVPMSMKLRPVTSITDTSATVGANVIKGSFEINSVSVSYRKTTDDEFTEAESLTILDETTGNKSTSCTFNELTPETSYIYKITAISSVNEVLEEEGYFKTTSSDGEGITVTGSVGYEKGFETNSTGKINVGIYEGKVCLRAEDVDVKVDPSQDGMVYGDFSFDSIPDGNYNIIATDGTYSKTTGLMIKDGLIKYPSERIELLLSGVNTVVEFESEDTPNITVDNLNSIITKSDIDSIPENGSIEYKLIAKSVNVPSDSEVYKALYRELNNESHLKFYDFTLKRIIYDADGNKISEDSSEDIHLTDEEISISIPLGEYSSDPTLKIFRIHGDNTSYKARYLPDEDGIGNSTYTFSTNQFSIFALVHSVGEEPTTATTADITTQQPTTSYNVQSVGDSVTPTTTEHVPVPQSVYDEPEDDDDDDDDVKEIKEKTTKPKTSSTTSVGSLTSSGSAKTGDTSPIAVIFGFMMLSVCGIIVLRKKCKNIE